MKVELWQDGTLCITPESGLEQFALEAWSEDYFKHNGQFSMNDGEKIKSMPKTSLLIAAMDEST